jgi:hypothetical protein
MYFKNLHRLVPCITDAQFKLVCKETGLCKPSLFVGLSQQHSSGLPGCLAIDHMHIIAINLPNLLVGLWCGTIDCDKNDSKELWDWVMLVGDTWKSHRQDVVCCRPYLPGSFDCPPRNPAEKITSGYKAWEFLIYVFGYCPALLHGVLPLCYWQNFCKLVSAVRLLQQRAITATQVRSTHLLVLSFIEEYEALCYRRMTTQLHFCRQSIHGLSHLAPDAVCLGPGVYSSQWTLERTISNLGEKIKQPSNPYTNLANCSLHHSQISALHALLPDLEPDTHALPQGTADLGDSYVLLRAWDMTGTVLEGEPMNAIRVFLVSESEHGELPPDWHPRYIRWARLQLPNLQIACCAWKETAHMSSAEHVCRSCNVKVRHYTLRCAVGVYVPLYSSLWGGPSVSAKYSFSSEATTLE